MVETTEENRPLASRQRQIHRLGRGMFTVPRYSAYVPRFEQWGPCIQKRDPHSVPVFVRAVKNGRRTSFVVSEVLAGLRTKPKHMSVQTWWRTLALLGFEPFLVPDKKRLGLYFRKFIRDLQRCGYDVAFRCLSAANHGAATNRVRFFLQAVRRDTKKRIFWPDATHGRRRDDGSVPAGLLPWRVAREVVDLADRGDPLIGRRRALAKNTLRRVAYGFVNYALPEALAKIAGVSETTRVRLRIKSGTTEEAVELALSARPAPAVRAQTPGLSSAFILPQQAAGEGATSLDMPFRTIAGKGAEALVHAFLVSAAHGNDTDRVEENFRRAKSLDTPLCAITGGRDWAVCSAFLVPNFGERPGQAPRTHLLSAPMPTITSHGAGGLVTVMLAKALDRDSAQEVLLDVGDESYRVEFFYRMAKARELSLAQSFPPDYEFHGTNSEIVKQIGNAVPPLVARAIFLGYLRQTSRVGLPTGRLAIERQQIAA